LLLFGKKEQKCNVNDSILEYASIIRAVNRLFIALMIEAICTSEISAYSETTRRYIPEGSNLQR
jgi:hypothetical protein